MTSKDPLLNLLARFHDEEVEYVLVGGQAVRLTKTDYREKDLLDKMMLLKIKDGLA